MAWNWQNPEWPNFTWDRRRIESAEEQFLLGSGVVIGSVKHLSGEDHKQLLVELMSGEAVTTSKIEGETLNRDSVQSSIQRQLGLAADKRRASPAEQGIAEMMVDLYRSFREPLSQETLFTWHKMVTAGRRDLADIGRYRTSKEPMQIVSGRIGASKVHFQAPPSERVPSEMTGFIAWFNQTAPDGGDSCQRSPARASLTSISNPFTRSRMATVASAVLSPRKPQRRLWASRSFSPWRPRPWRIKSATMRLWREPIGAST